ncbi:MAG: restriction endonuclease subunit S [Saprospiraceae bacterium]|nr:restriction endonuclease subunit S [Saprospiraceae bacterium]
MSEEREIPKGWVETTLGEIAKKETTKVNPTDKPNAKFIGMDCIQPNSMKSFFHHSFGDFKSSGNWFSKNHVLYGRMRPYLNKVFKATYDGACSGEFIVLNSEGVLFPDFLAYILHHRDFVRFANSKTSGDRPRISFDEISGYSILLPPRPEQHRIVSKIEELFSSLDKGIESLKTAQAQLKVYRQAVLKWAFEGRLTNQKVKEGELPEGWVSKMIAEIGKVKGGKRLPKGHDYSEYKTSFPYLRVTDFENLTIKQDKLKYLFAETQQQIKNYIISKADVFISIAGTIGQVGVIPENLDGANLTENAAKITELKGVFNKYLANYLASKTAQIQIAGHTIATTQPKLSLFRIEKINIPLPPTLSEQHLIVSEIESRLSVCDKIEESIAVSLQQAEALRQSILKKAFEGRLVPQDPNDEPAAVLLARIKAERGRAAKNPAVRKKKKSHE